MASANSSEGSPSGGRYVAETVERSAKILVVGAFGVGKTTIIGSVSEIAPLRTEEAMRRYYAAMGPLYSRKHDPKASEDGRKRTTHSPDANADPDRGWW